MRACARQDYPERLFRIVLYRSDKTPCTASRFADRCQNTSRRCSDEAACGPAKSAYPDIAAKIYPIVSAFDVEQAIGIGARKPEMVPVAARTGNSRSPGPPLFAATSCDADGAVLVDHSGAPDGFAKAVDDICDGSVIGNRLWPLARTCAVNAFRRIRTPWRAACASGQVRQVPAQGTIPMPAAEPGMGPPPPPRTGCRRRCLPETRTSGYDQT